MCRLIFGKRSAKGNPFGSFQAQPAHVAPNYQNNYQPIYQTQQQHYQPIYQQYQYHHVPHQQQQRQHQPTYYSIPQYSNQAPPPSSTSFRQPVKYYKPPPQQQQQPTPVKITPLPTPVKTTPLPTSIKSHSFKQPTKINQPTNTSKPQPVVTSQPKIKTPPSRSQPVATAAAASTPQTTPKVNNDIKISPKPVPAPAPVPAPVPKPVPAPVLAPYISQVEQTIRTAKRPIQSKSLDVIEINGIRGIWLNKEEVENWKGDIPISQYTFNQDQEPEIVKIKQDGCIDMVHNFSIKYLKPPRPLTPGPIIIKQEANIPTAPAPPIIIRQIPDERCNPPPVVIREKPPTAPEPIAPKIVVVPGQRLPPPPRRVIIEKLPQLPSQPEAVQVERWLPYDKRERKVILEQKPCDPCVPKQKNAVIEWEAPCVTERTEVRDLGVETTDPIVYAQKYGTSLKSGNQLPKFALDAKPPAPLDGVVEVDLTGDLHGLKLFNLEKEGLSQYQKYVR